jgi:hypothetical protein
MLDLSIGPLTSLMEAAAAAIGAGMLLGGFVTGVAGLVLAWPKKEFEARVLQEGYVGGVVAAGVVFADIILRYTAI